ncbi:MAG: hypothetical protein K6E33_07355, partial [Lachnospiraceae bacterium]|nr:hypothetical protein [Lachnospiraceae bacterium]
YAAGQGYTDGQGYEAEQGYADGQGYGAEQGYADGQGYAAPQGNGVTRGNRGAHYYSKAEILQGLSPELQPASVMVEPMTQQDADAGTNDAYERAHEIMSLMKQDTDKIKVQGQKTADKIPGAKTGTLTPLNAGSTKLDGLLLQNVDGQITLNIPDSQKLIKQITGQMDIGDVLDEWERVKKENEKKRREEIKQRIMQSTSDIFSDFDEATRNGLLEQLERAYVESMSKDEAEGKKEYTPAQKRRNEREKNARIKAAAVKAAEEERSKHPDQFETEADDADGRYEEDSRDSADSYRDAGDARDDRDAGGDGRDADSRYEDEDIRGREDERASDREDRGYRDDRDDRDDRDAGDYRDAGGRYEDADDGVTEGDAAGAVSEESEPERSRDRDRRKSGDDSRNRSRDKADDEEEVMRHVNEAIDAVEEADTGKKAEAPKQKAERKAKAADAKRQALTPEEEELFGRFIKNGKERAQIIAALDRMSMAAYAGNVVLVGSKEAGTLDLAKNLLKQMRRQDSNFTGRIAKINGRNLAQKDDLQKIVSQARDGALIIEDAALMGEEKAKSFASALENTNDGILVIMTDRKERLRQLFAHVQSLKKMFDIRINVRPMDDDALVEYARDYAESRDCTIDEFGFLALHERIADMQTADHEVTPSEIRDVVDEAIYWAEKKNLSYFWNTVLGRRYDENDMVILKEKDFQHYR